MGSESSAVIQFIADNQRRPVDRGIFSRKYAPPVQAVLLPVKANPWKARLTIAAALLVAGVAGGLYASQTAPGRWLVQNIGSAQTELAATHPAPAPAPVSPETAAAAIAPCPPAAAPLAAAPVAPAPPPASPAPVATAIPVAAVMTAPVEPAPARTAVKPDERPRRAGTLRIRSTPSCDILIDGRRTGLRTPQRSLELKPGKHTVELVNKKQKIRTKFSVRIKSGKTTRVSKKLRSKKR